MFPIHVISRRGYIAWSSRSPDLSTPWGTLARQSVRQKKPRALGPLKQHIMDEIRANDEGLMRSGMVTFWPRLQECIVCHGDHSRYVIVSNNQRTLNGTLTPILLHFRIQINQNSDLEIIIFYWRILHKFHQAPQCSRAAVRMHNCPHLPPTLRVHVCVHMSRPLVPILSHTTPVHILKSSFKDPF